MNFLKIHENSKNGDSVPASQEEKPKTASGFGVLNPPSRESSRDRRGPVLAKIMRFEESRPPRPTGLPNFYLRRLAADHLPFRPGLRGEKMNIRGPPQMLPP